MSDFIDISKLTGIQKFIADKCNIGGSDKNLTKNDNGYDEVSIFNQAMKEYEESGQQSFSVGNTLYTKISDVLGFMNFFKTNNFANFCSSGENIQERTKNAVEAEAKKRSNQELDVEYWTDLISSISEEYDIDPAIIASIVGREVNFAKKQHGANGTGAMQITTAAIRDFYPTSTGNWNKEYQLMDEELLDDVLYKTTDGKKELRFNTPKELRDACGKDDEYGMKVGLLVLKKNFVVAVARLKYGPDNDNYRLNYSQFKKALNGLKDGTIQLTESEYKKCLANAAFYYNGNSAIQKNYRTDVQDSLVNVQKFNFDYENNPIIKRNS